MSSLDWPRGARTCDGDAEEREGLAKRMRAAHEKAWSGHESVKTLLRRHYPTDWAEVKKCRMDKYYDYAMRRGDDAPNLVILRPQCRRLPFCPACNDVASHRRASGMLRRLRMALPRGKKLRSTIVTIGVSPRDDDWRLPELVASDIKRFKRACYRAIEAAYGKGVGVLLTYQHYGQDILVRERPHVHALLAPFLLDPAGEPERVPAFDLADGGRDRLDEIVARELNRAFPEAGGASVRAWLSGNDVNVQTLDGPESVAKSAKYVARELIDFRDIEYDPLRKLVYVNPYREQGPAVLDVPTFQRNLSLYNARFQSWSDAPGRRVFDSAFGALSDRRANATADAMEADRDHRAGCWCHECSAWSRMMSDEIDGAGDTLDDFADGWR